MTLSRIEYPLTEVVRDTLNGQPSEVAIYDNTGLLVGYWAYGSFDPELPYQGKQPEEKPELTYAQAVINSVKHKL